MGSQWKNSVQRAEAYSVALWLAHPLKTMFCKSSSVVLSSAVYVSTRYSTTYRCARTIIYHHICSSFIVMACLAWALQKWVFGTAASANHLMIKLNANISSLSKLNSSHRQSEKKAFWESWSGWYQAKSRKLAEIFRTLACFTIWIPTV